MGSGPLRNLGYVSSAPLPPSQSPTNPPLRTYLALSKSALSALSNAQYRALLSPTSLLNSAFHLWFHTLNSHFIRFETERTTIPVLVPQCTGVVLELGPGTGNQLCRFDRSKIQRIVGVESNPLFVPDVEEQVRLCGLEGVYDLVVAGVEDGAALERAGLVAGSVDTVLSVQVLCSVDEPERVARELYELLKPGGKLIFWEHHRSSDWWTRAAQCEFLPTW